MRLPVGLLELLIRRCAVVVGHDGRAQRDITWLQKLRRPRQHARCHARAAGAERAPTAATYRPTQGRALSRALAVAAVDSGAASASGAGTRATLSRPLGHSATLWRGLCTPPGRRSLSVQRRLSRERRESAGMHSKKGRKRASHSASWSADHPQNHVKTNTQYQPTTVVNPTSPT